jgi:hypothetical protein
MKYIFKTLFLVAFLLIPQLGFSQNETINYTLTSEVVNVSGVNTAMTSTILKSGSNLTWNQINSEGVETTHFNITGIIENWNQTTNSGTINYQMDTDGYQTLFSLVLQESEVITATLTFIISETQQEIYIFNIDTITYQ